MNIGILLIVALVFWFAFGLAYWAFTTRLRLGRDRREHRRRASDDSTPR